MMRRPTTFLKTCLVAASLFCASCGTVTGTDGGNADGGFEAGNPPAPATTRSLTGEVERSDGAALTRHVSASETAATNCVADTVVAESSAGEKTSAEIDGDCQFTIELTVGVAYSLHFELGGGFVGALVFSNNPEAFDSSVLVIAAGDADIDVGVISFADGLAVPENSPAVQNDQDGDGISDAEDEDDDGNGIADLAEEDCDLDGIADVIDAILSDCDGAGSDGEDEAADGEDDGAAGDGEAGNGETSVEPAAVLEVLPRNNAGINSTIAAPGLTATVAARADCALDLTTVTAASFSVADEGGAVIDCDYSLGSSDGIVGCSHAAEPFVSLGIYTATLSGLTCEDGRPVQTLSWSWMALGVSLGL